MKGPEEPDNYPAALTLRAAPISAIWSYYKDRQILSLGASGDVLIVATDSLGVAIGSDTGADMRLVEVDNYRIVAPVPMAFDQLVYGSIACWPECPVSFRDGLWHATDGQSYGVSSLPGP